MAMIADDRHTNGKGTRKNTEQSSSQILSFPTRTSTALLEELVLPPFDKWQILIFSVLIFVFAWHSESPFFLPTYDCSVVIVIWPMWAKMNDVTSPSAMREYIFKGIWVQCASENAGVYNCDNFLRPVFSLSAMAIMQRSFVIFSVTG